MKFVHVYMGLALVVGCGDAFTVAPYVDGGSPATADHPTVSGGDDAAGDVPELDAGAGDDVVAPLPPGSRDGGHHEDLDAGAIADVREDLVVAPPGGDAGGAPDVVQPPQTCSTSATCPSCPNPGYEMPCCTSAHVCGCQVGSFGVCR